MSISETVKAHPVVIAIAIFLIGGTIIYAMSGSETPAVTTVGNVQAASDAQNQSQQLAALGMQIQGQTQLQSDAISGQIQLAHISADLQYNANNLAASIANAQIQERATESTLTAQTQQKAIDAQVQQSAITANAIISQTQQLANVLITQIQEQNQTIRKTSCHGFGCLF
jgi:hypothetical protein